MKIIFLVRRWPLGLEDVEGSHIVIWCNPFLMLSGMFEAEWVQSKLTNDLPARHTMYYWPSDQHPGAAPGQCTHDVMSSSSEYHLEKKLRAEVMGSTRRIILGSKRKRVRESWENLQNTDRRRLPLLELLSKPRTEIERDKACDAILDNYKKPL